MKKKIIAVLMAAMMVSAMFTGCGGDKKSNESTSASGEAKKSKDSAGEAGDVFTSKVGDVVMTLPDSTWKVEMDDENGINLTSKEGTISIVRLGAEEAESMQMPTSEEAFSKQLSGMYVDSNFKIEDFSYTETEYQGAVSFDDTAAVGYGVYRGIRGSEVGYNISAALAQEDDSVDHAVKEAIFGIEIK